MRRTLGAGLVVAVLAGGADTALFNLIPNPAFESCTGDAPTSWFPFEGGDDVVACDTTDPQSGSSNLSLTNAPDLEFAGAESDCVSVGPGTAIEHFAFSYRTSSAAVSQVALSAYSFFGSECESGNAIQSVGAGLGFGQAVSSDGQWHTIAPAPLVIDPVTHSVRFVVSFQHELASGTATVHFDNVAFSLEVPDATTTTVTTSTTTSTTIPAVFPGTGKPASECYVTVRGIAATGNGRADCVDGAPCDADGAADGTCTFSFNVCVAQALAGCQATSITSVKAAPARRAVAVPPVPADVPTCGADASVAVPLRRRGRAPGKLALTFVARNSVKPKVDRDRLKLKCLPPS